MSVKHDTPNKTTEPPQGLGRSPDGFEAVPASWTALARTTIPAGRRPRETVCYLVGVRTTQPAVGPPDATLELKFVTARGCGATTIAEPGGRTADGRVVPRVVADHGPEHFAAARMLHKSTLSHSAVEKTEWDERVLEARYPGLNPQPIPHTDEDAETDGETDD